MKKIIFTIFAHPDDESFGPSGTILTETKAGNDVHLITLTMGEHGNNPDNVPDLCKVRFDEWQSAGKLLGAKSQHHLGFIDSHLSNSMYHEIADKIDAVIDVVLESIDHDVEIEFISNDLNGITGHIDHIVAARVACYVFCRRKKEDARFTRMRLVCLPRSAMPQSNTGWLYMNAGRRDDEIDEMVDARQYRDEIIKIMCSHYSQRGDCEANIKARGEDIGLDYFMLME